MKNEKMNPPVVFITGAAKRLGAAMARYFHAKGFFVFVHYHTSAASAEVLCADLETIRPNSAVSLQADLSDINHLSDISTHIIAKGGRLDVLVNNASRFYKTSFSETTETQFDELMNCNLKSVYFLTQVMLPFLTASKGTVINMLDAQLSLSMPQFPVYFMSKAALAALTTTLAVELAPDVRVNAVAPGYILWPEEVSWTEQQKSALLDTIPQKRLGTPEEVAEAVFFLANGPQYITGQTLRVDGARVIV